MQDEIKAGAEAAVRDFLSLENCARLGERPLDLVRDGVEKAFSKFLEEHKREIIDAIARREP